MKIKNIVKIILLSTIISLTSCKNPVNENTLLVNNGAPTSETEGIEGQLYLDKETFDIYEYTNSSWINVGNLKGKDGLNGTNGLNGADGVDGTDGADGADGEKGDKGEKGEKGDTGNQGPQGEKGDKGDKGDPGTTPTIEIIDGYWYINGVNTNVKATGDGNTDTVVEEKITPAEIRTFEAVTGSFPWKTNLKRARIEVGIKLKKGAVVKFLGDLDKYRWAVVETYNLDVNTSGTYLDSSWNRTWADEKANYISTLNGGYLVLTVGIMDRNNVEKEFTQNDLDMLHDLFEIDGYKYTGQESNENQSNGGISINNDIMKSINHRGYNTEAPENTLSAYRLSAKNGFKYVETDVNFTKDNIPVLLHDDTIDRTSNGTGNITSLTYAQASSYDYGSWFNEANPDIETSYAGEKLPKFEDFIILCKRLDLHPYIELKGTLSLIQAKTLLDIVGKCNMTNNVSWISFNASALSNIVKNDPCARVGLVTNSKIDQNKIDIVNNTLKTGQNEVFFDAYYTQATSDVIDLCYSNSIPLEVWTVNSKDNLLNLHPYISGVTSDSLNAKEVLKQYEMGD